VDIVQRHWAASRRLAPTEGDAPRGGRSFTRAAPPPSHGSDPIAMDAGATASPMKLTSLLILGAGRASRSVEDRRR
jgi:hypothetical protein